jgi:TetR/AcrR family fatty acid metabolism transcriptional regulator
MEAKTGHSSLRKGRKVTKRGLQAIETRNRIYESATKLMERNGFDNITIEQISKAASVSVGAFYHHFGSKTDILNEIFKRADDYFSQQVVNQLSGNDICEKIVNYFVHYARFNIGLGLDHVSALYKTQSKFFISTKRPMFAALRDIIVKGIENNEIKSVLSADEITDFLFTSARGLAYSWCLHNGEFSLEEKMRRFMDYQVRAICTPSQK